jgi:hypothetical protein
MIFLRKGGWLSGVMLPVLLALPLLLTGPAPKAGAQNTGRAILVRGNGWVTGISGLGDNVFPALAGQYRLETAEGDRSPAETSAFSIWLTTEPLVFAEGTWQPRNGLPGALERESGEGRFISLPLSTERGAWTAVFLFHAGAVIPDAAGINRLVNAWTDRFLYYVSLIKIPTDVSMPAVVSF